MESLGTRLRPYSYSIVRVASTPGRPLEEGRPGIDCMIAHALNYPKNLAGNRILSVNSSYYITV